MGPNLIDSSVGGLVVGVQCIVDRVVVKIQGPGVLIVICCFDKILANCQAT